MDGLSAETLPEGRSARWYRTVEARAASNGNNDLALAAARSETEKQPQSAAAWHRLAFASTLANGAPTRESLGALLKAYDIAPFAAPNDMIWRVEYAARYYRSMPDPVIRRTLSQIEALGSIAETWETRTRWCRQFPDGALADAACATVPGINRDH